MMLLTALVLVVLLIALAREVSSPAALLLSALVALVLGGVISFETAFRGFSSAATLSIAGLYIVSQALQDHVQLSRLLRPSFRGDRSERRVLGRILPAIAGISSVANNTPIVAVLAPALKVQAARSGLAAQRLLIPLSYAAILGGMLTLIGTSTNLVASSMLVDLGLEPLGFFELTSTALPVVAVGLLATIVLARHLLPDRREPVERSLGSERRYTTVFVVAPDGPLDGVTLLSAGLRSLPDAYISSIQTASGHIVTAEPTTVLRGGDRILLDGGIAAVEVLKGLPGLVEGEHSQSRHLSDSNSHLYECIIGANSGLLGRTLKETSFRGRYAAVVVSIHREGATFDGRLGTKPLKAGDSLLLRASPSFAATWEGHRDFLAVIPYDDAQPRATNGFRSLTIAVFLLMVGAVASGLLPVTTAAFAACAILIVSGAISFERALSSLNLDILIVVSAALGLGGAIEASGLSDSLTMSLSSVLGSGKVIPVLLLVVTTVLLTELITNVAAVALMLPIASHMATLAQLEPRPLLIAVTLAASASFLTPIGYQTNTIVYGIGHYRFLDFVRFGLPVTSATVGTIVLMTLI